MPAGRENPSTSTPAIVPTTVPGLAGTNLGLQSADVNLNTPTSAGSPASPHGTYLSGQNGIAANADAPVLPLQVEDATVDGQGPARRRLPRRDLHGHARRHAADQQRLDADRVTEPAGVHLELLRPGPGLPDELLRRARPRRRVDEPPRHAGPVPERRRDRDPADLRQRQPPPVLQLEPPGNAALAAAPAITNIAGIASGKTVTFQATVTGDPSAGIQSVWITWTGAGAAATISGSPSPLNADVRQPEPLLRDPDAPVRRGARRHPVHRPGGERRRPRDGVRQPRRLQPGLRRVCRDRRSPGPASRSTPTRPPVAPVPTRVSAPR